MLNAGTRLGPYDIVAPLGAGGMGEVYRASDPRLGREVAIKVLPAAVSSDPERLARFEQEARATAALNHPNILAVHDIGNADGIVYVVSELLEGETLRDALAHGALATRLAADYAVQIAHGLAAAHDKEIVHRDLKPENVFVTRDGRVKILDFGLAKLIQAAPAFSGTMMPTTRLGTAAGMVVGTVGYMAPEQVRGQTVDHRADIFAFGAILYELLTGERAFAGESPADTVSAILKEDPPQLADAGRVRGPALQRIVQRCLEKKPEQRFHAAHDLAYAIEAVTAPTASGVASAPDVTNISPRAGRGTRWLAITAAVATIAALALLVVATRHWTERPPLHLLRFTVPLPEGRAWRQGPTPISVSPDGRTIAMSLTSVNGSHIWTHRLDTFASAEVPGTDNAGSVVSWSPDSRSIVFNSADTLKRVELDGGPATPLLQLKSGAAQVTASAWGTGGILFSQTGGALRRVSDTGGVGQPATTLEVGDTAHTEPAFFADGRRFFFLRVTCTGPAGVYVGALDGAPPRRVLPEASSARAAGPYVVFGRDRSIVAQRFDSSTLTASGDIAILADDVRLNQALGARNLAYAAATDAFVVAYLTGQGTSRMIWLDRTGIERGAPLGVGTFATLALARDDSHVAFSQSDSAGNQTIWVNDLIRNVSSRLTAGPRESDPAWSPDGARLAYTELGAGKRFMTMPSAGGVGIEAAQSLSMSSGVDDWSRDGRYLLYHDVPGELFALELSGSHEKIPVHSVTAGRPPDEGAFSPDSHAVAFNTEETGRSEVYVKSFPPTGEKWQLSNAGGMQPRWRADGRELYYLAPDGTMMVVEITSPPPALKASAPRALFKTRLSPQYGQDQYAVTRDGQRFLLIDPIVEESLLPLRVIVDWPALFEKR